MPLRFVIIGGGPAGNTAATTAARLGAEVTLIERDIVGGAAHLRDCIPSKAMIATGGAMGDVDASHGMGLAVGDPELDLEGLRHRIKSIEARLEHNVVDLLRSQGVRMIQGTGRLKGPHEVVVETAEGVARDRGRRHPAVDRQPAPHPRLGRRSTATGSSPPATPTRRPRCPSTWWSSGRA